LLFLWIILQQQEVVEILLAKHLCFPQVLHLNFAFLMDHFTAAGSGWNSVG